jgi:YD repeat-containing protein
MHFIPNEHPMLTGVYKRMRFCLWAILFAFPSVSNAISVKSYSYDQYGNLKEITDPRGFVTQYHYDLLNRLEKIEYPDDKRVKYSYDLSGIRIKMEDHRGATLFEPDEFGKINKVTFPDGQSVAYRYDSEGNLIKLVYPDSTEVEYAYDLSNRLKTVKDSSGITKFEYDELSNAPRKKTLPNGM